MGMRDLKPLYAPVFPNTWELDLKVADLMELDYEIEEIAQKLLCSEQDVWDAFARIKFFLYPGLSIAEILERYPPEFPKPTTIQ